MERQLFCELWDAAQRGDVSLLQTVGQGVFSKQQLQTALWIAVHNDHGEAVTALVVGATALFPRWDLVNYLDRRRWPRPGGPTALHVAARCDNPDAVRALLRDCGQVQSRQRPGPTASGGRQPARGQQDHVTLD